MDESRLKLLSAGFKLLKTPLDICLWPGSVCSRNAICAHSVQNRKVLEQLSVKGHVIMPQLRITKPPEFIFNLVGRNKATTFTGLCAEHDNELFKEIDDNDINIKNDYHLYLLSFRSVLREAHASRKSAINSQLVYQEGVKQGIYPNEPCAPGIFAVENVIAAYQVEEVKHRFDQAFLSGTYKNLSHFIISLAAGPKVAVSSMFSSGLWCDSTDSLAFLTLNVFPNYKGVSYAVFSCIREHEPQVKIFITPILEASGHYRLYLLSKLILRKCENMVISPVLFDSYSQKQRNTMLHYFERSAFDHNFDIDSQYLYLFGPIS